MTVPGGVRRPNNTGCIRPRLLASGARRYHTNLRGKYLGCFETRAEAQRAIDAALAELEARGDIVKQ
jgi:hypothetical protein